MSEEIPQKPMSIEQAGNYLAEKQETLAEDMKNEAKAAPITLASGEDRIKYLMYGMSLLEDISESAKNTWCAIANKPAAIYTTKEVCAILRKLVALRINGYSMESIAHHLHTTVVVLEKAEALAIDEIRKAIARSQDTRIPIIGGRG